MSRELNHTHDKSARTWVASANAAGSDFPIQNPPLAIFRRQGVSEHWRGGVAIGDQILDLAALAEKGILDGAAERAVEAGAGATLNALLELGPVSWRALRHGVFELLLESATDAIRADVGECLVAQSVAKYAVPVKVGNYSDYYTSLFHAENIEKHAGIKTMRRTSNGSR